MQYWQLNKAGVSFALQVVANESAAVSHQLGLLNQHLESLGFIAQETALKDTFPKNTAPKDTSPLVAENHAPPIKLALEANPEGWLINDLSAEVTHTATALGDVLYYLSDRCVYHLANTATEYYCLHAGAVSLNGRALIIPAASGSGKSSLTAWLVANGFSYITDELVLIDAAGRVDGFARPIQIKASGLCAIEPLLKTPLTALGKLASGVSATELGGHCAQQLPHTLGAFLFPSYAANSAYAFTPMSSAQAGLQLMSQHVNARNLPNHGFDMISEWARTAPKRTLNYNGFAALPHDFAEQVGHLTQAKAP